MSGSTREFSHDCGAAKATPILEVSLPGLSTVARIIFAIPASQNKTERSFSAAIVISSLPVTDWRNALDPERLDELMLLRSHCKQNNAFRNDGDDDKDSE